MVKTKVKIKDKSKKLRVKSSTAPAYRLFSAFFVFSDCSYFLKSDINDFRNISANLFEPVYVRCTKSFLARGGSLFAQSVMEPVPPIAS